MADFNELSHMCPASLTAFILTDFTIPVKSRFCIAAYKKATCGLFGTPALPLHLGAV